jgi:hypothetical protein
MMSTSRCPAPRYGTNLSKDITCELDVSPTARADHLALLQWTELEQHLIARLWPTVLSEVSGVNGRRVEAGPSISDMPSGEHGSVGPRCDHDRRCSRTSRVPEGRAFLWPVPKRGVTERRVVASMKPLHYEFKPRGVYVTVVAPPLTNTPVLAKLGFDPRTMPMKPMSVEQCVSEGLSALRENRSRVVPGRMNRIMNALVPASVKRTFTAKMLGKSLANKPSGTPATGSSTTVGPGMSESSATSSSARRTSAMVGSSRASTSRSPRPDRP